MYLFRPTQLWSPLGLNGDIKILTAPSLGSSSKDLEWQVWRVMTDTIITDWPRENSSQQDPRQAWVPLRIPSDDNLSLHTITNVSDTSTLSWEAPNHKAVLRLEPTKIVTTAGNYQQLIEHYRCFLFYNIYIPSYHETLTNPRYNSVRPQTVTQNIDLYGAFLPNISIYYR